MTSDEKEKVYEKPLTVPLYVIKRLYQTQFWACSSEHGCGWHDHTPKQAFTKSEISKEVYRLIDKGYATDFVVLQLAFANISSMD